MAITTIVPITRATLLACPSVKLVCALAIGTDHVDLVACKELGVTVCNVPAASNESVAEHAISFYFALRRRTVVLHELAKGGKEWKERGSLKGVFGKEFPVCAKDEVVGIVGPGELGVLFSSDVSIVYLVFSVAGDGDSCSFVLLHCIVLYFVSSIANATQEIE